MLDTESLSEPAIRSTCVQLYRLGGRAGRQYRRSQRDWPRLKL